MQEYDENERKLSKLGDFIDVVRTFASSSLDANVTIIHLFMQFVM